MLPLGGFGRIRSDQGETVGALQSRGLGFGWAPRTQPLMVFLKGSGRKLTGLASIPGVCQETLFPNEATTLPIGSPWEIPWSPNSLCL